LAVLVERLPHIKRVALVVVMGSVQPMVMELLVAPNQAHKVVETLPSTVVDLVVLVTCLALYGVLLAVVLCLVAQVAQVEFQ
jgi:hypothetical protein